MAATEAGAGAFGLPLRRRLTDAEVEAIVAAAVEQTDLGERAAAFVLGALETLAGHRIDRDHEPVELGSVAVPEDQWIALSIRLQEMTSAGGALLWMNNGPSSYREGA